MDIKDSEYFALQEYLQHHLKNIAKLSPEEFFSLVVHHLKYYAHKNSLQFIEINQLSNIYSIGDDLIFVKLLSKNH